MESFRQRLDSLRGRWDKREADYIGCGLRNRRKRAKTVDEQNQWESLLLELTELRRERQRQLDDILPQLEDSLGRQRDIRNDLANFIQR